MQLSYLSVRLKDYGSNEGKYEGEVTFKAQYGETKVLLDPKLSHAVLQLCAEALVEQARQTANLIACDVLEQTKSPTAIESKEQM